MGLENRWAQSFKAKIINVEWQDREIQAIRKRSNTDCVQTGLRNKMSCNFVFVIKKPAKTTMQDVTPVAEDKKEENNIF